jgi:uncharacterized lipoprotein YajG
MAQRVADIRQPAKAAARLCPLLGALVLSGCASAPPPALAPPPAYAPPPPSNNAELLTLQKEIDELQAEITAIKQKTDYICINNQDGYHTLRYCQP